MPESCAPIHAQLADFGGALKLGPSGDAAVLMATPGYMAPEMVVSRRATKATDVYAFGLTMMMFMATDPVVDFFADGPFEAVFALAGDAAATVSLLYGVKIMPCAAMITNWRRLQGADQGRARA